MQNHSTVNLKVKPDSISNVFEWILKESAGKSVLNIGASGGVEAYLPDHQDIWLHYKLSKVAKKIVGLDIDRESIKYAARHGVEILEGNCETVQFKDKFEIIVMSDVIEHLNAPGLAVKNLMNHLDNHGKLLITTPNPTHYGLIGRAIFMANLSIYYDHVNCFLPEHIQAICDRFNYSLNGIYFFGHIDKRNFKNQVKSYIGNLAGKISPRLYSSFLAVIEHSGR